MEQSTPAVVAPPSKLVLPEKTSELTPLQRGWLQMSAKREYTFTQLQKQELAVQAAVKELTALDKLPDIQAKLKEIKGYFAEQVDCRKQFTGIIKEKLIDTAMEFEKRTEPLVKEAEAHEFKIRKAEAAKAAANAEKDAEKVRFRTHVQNEYIRIGAKYRMDLLRNINSAYDGCITARTPAKDIPFKMFEQALAEIKLDKFQKFGDFHWITADEATAIFKEVEAFNGSEDLQDALKGLKSKFAMYEQDLQNVEAALKRSIEEAKRQENEIEAEQEMEQATNTLVGEGSIPTFAGPKVKRKMEIVFENNEEWVVSVVAAFMNNFSRAKFHVRNKTWDKLTLAQMAAALAAIHNEDGKTTFTGLKFKEVEK